MVNATQLSLAFSKQTNDRSCRKSETRISGHYHRLLFVPIKVGVERLVKNVLTIPLDRADPSSLPVFTEARKTGEFIKRLYISTSRTGQAPAGFPKFLINSRRRENVSFFFPSPFSYPRTQNLNLKHAALVVRIGSSPTSRAFSSSGDYFIKFRR